MVLLVRGPKEQVHNMGLYFYRLELLHDVITVAMIHHQLTFGIVFINWSLITSGLWKATKAQQKAVKDKQRMVGIW